VLKRGVKNLSGKKRKVSEQFAVKSEKVTTMRTPEVKNFIEDHQHLFWYSPAPKSETVSDELLVEMVLNYGSMNDLRSLFAVMGIKGVAKIFFDSIGKSERRKGNYHELTLNYFTLLFNRYAS
jgi:hypothetical protein